MKFLKLDEVGEKVLIQVFDGLLKSTGLQCHNLIQQLLDRVTEHPDAAPSVPLVVQPEEPKE